MGAEEEEEEQSHNVGQDRSPRDSHWLGSVSPLTVLLLVSGARGDRELPGWGLWVGCYRASMLTRLLCSRKSTLGALQLPRREGPGHAWSC